MRLHEHVIASTALSAGVYAATGSPEVTAGCFLAGIFMDLDHIFDYWMAHPFKMNISHFFETCEEYRLKKTYLFVHSFEFAPVLGLIAYYTRSPWIVGAFLGWLPHMIFDIFMNGAGPYTYFLTYRVLKRFELKELFIPPPHRIKKHGKDQAC